MTKKQIVKVVEQYDQLIFERTNTSISERMPENFDWSSVNQHSPENFTVACAHLRWMCKQVPVFLVEERVEKAMRWLGFLQGALWALGFRSVEELKNDNMPPDAVLDRSRV